MAPMAPQGEIFARTGGSTTGRPKATFLLDDLPELADGLSGERLAAARRGLRARVFSLPQGSWSEPDWPRSVREGAGLIVTDGLLIRRVGIDARYGAELLARGDLLRPWQREDSVASVTRRSGWRVLRRSHIAVLDLDFLHRAAPFPEIVGMLLQVTLRRARALAVNMAIVHQPRVETRVHMLLWHLADRWGSVRPDGVVLPVRLTHAILADLVAAQRPTVTAALSALQRDGQVERVADGWLLRQSPPGELTDVEVPAPAAPRRGPAG